MLITNGHAPLLASVSVSLLNKDVTVCLKSVRETNPTTSHETDLCFVHLGGTFSCSCQYAQQHSLEKITQLKVSNRTVMHD